LGLSVLALQIQQQETKERDKYVRPENYTCIAGCEIMGNDHLAHMADSGSKRENSGSHDGRETKVKASERSQEPDGSEAEARHADFELEWAVGPADESCRHFTEEHVHNEIVKIVEADAEKYISGNHLFDDQAPIDGCARMDDGYKRSDQSK
jgi:hypothetical protein